MGRKHYTKAELSKRRRANALIAKMDEAALTASLIPGSYIKNETLAIYEETVATYQKLKFHYLTDLDKPILEAYADAVAYWRFYKRKKDEALSELNKNKDGLLESGMSKALVPYTIPTETAAVIAYCEKMHDLYFKRMMQARDHLSLTPIQLAKFIKAMQEIEDHDKAKKDEADPIEAMFGDDFKVQQGDDEQ